jgi:hypothetical protein
MVPVNRSGKPVLVPSVLNATLANVLAAHVCGVTHRREKQQPNAIASHPDDFTNTFNLPLLALKSPQEHSALLRVPVPPGHAKVLSTFKLNNVYDEDVIRSS